MFKSWNVKSNFICSYPIIAIDLWKEKKTDKLIKDKDLIQFVTNSSKIPKQCFNKNLIKLLYSESHKDFEISRYNTKDSKYSSTIPWNMQNKFHCCPESYDSFKKVQQKIGR